MNPRKIFYFCYDHQRPRGGQKEMYRHVDLLNENGYRAYIVHTMDGFRLDWFKNNTKVIDWQTFSRLCHSGTDYIVFPEDFGKRISSFTGNKIIFNQNVYYGLYAFGFGRVDKLPYLDSDVKFVMTVSGHNEKYLKFIFPDLALRRIYYGVDQKRFIYRPITMKKKVISIMPGKSPVDNAFLYQAVSARAKQNLNKLKNYKWQLLDMYSEKKITQIFGESLVFVFLGSYEGCPLSPLEAMLSGALVVAHRGGPQAEYLNDSNSFLVDFRDQLGLIRKVEDIAIKFASKKEDLIKMSRRALETAREYSLEREKKSVLEFWKEVFHSQ